MVVEIGYVPGGKYTMAFLVVDPLRFSPHRWLWLLVWLGLTGEMGSVVTVILFVGHKVVKAAELPSRLQAHAGPCLLPGNVNGLGLVGVNGVALAMTSIGKRQQVFVQSA